ncbi:uncharacterized protein LOC123547254 [Mercenaria mercenaria]|uniref:uncharacterized protein LOC123547254 n=1 Tax=Mercenaria mercenaria TaxID=6596 RepID=UPI00234EB765|nr:uncharacterized protein LOC123547254 [Mercenaria mercenaria]XP_053407515.1 uncharacterized protein LOC123547254 [Mercenaria mercenaria]
MRNYFCIFIVSIALQLIYAQQLQKVPSKLSALAALLHRDQDIQTEINRLARDGQQVANSFKRMLEADGSKILTEKNRLVKTSNPTEVKVDALRNTLKAARDSLKSEHRDIITLENDIHKSIETCNGRKKHHDTERLATNQKLETIPKEIAILNEQIKAHDDSIGALDKSARDLDNRAENLRWAARQKTENRIIGGVFGGVIGGIVGFALAPFTGWTSLAIATAAAGFGVGVNLDDADDCNRNARRLRDDAASERRQAQTLRSERGTLEVEKRTLQSEISALHTSSGELQQAADGVHDVSRSLRSSVDDIVDLLRAIGDMDTAMKEAELQSDFFVIIQNAFARNPETLGATSQPYLDKLKEKWIRLEKILVHHGAKASLT